MRRDIEFTSGGETVRGWLYTPDTADGPLPVVVMAGGWCYVKELVQPHYAELYADAGFAAILFDYRNFGSSDGAPRQHIDPWMQIEDYKNAISFAETAGRGRRGPHRRLGDVVQRRARAHRRGDRSAREVHRVADPGRRRLPEPPPHLRDARLPRLRGGGPRGSRRRFATGEGGTWPHATDPANGLSTWPFPETEETFRELKAREAPAYQNLSTIESAELLMSYSVDPFLPRMLNTPTLVVVAERDDLTLWDLEIDAYNPIPTAKKRLVVVGDSTHMTLYSDRSLLMQAAAAARDWFAEHLVAGAPAAVV